MTPKEKAQELIDRVSPLADYQECDCFTEQQNMLKNSKELALIICAEVVCALGDCTTTNEWLEVDVRN